MRLRPLALVPPSHPHHSGTKVQAAACAAQAEAAALEGLGTEWNERTTGDGRKMRSRGKKRDRQPAVSKHETTWVACDKCGKWRKLPPGVRLPEEQASSKWQCKQNVWDKKRAKCSAAEEPWA